VELVRLAVASGLFPLYEVWNGSAWRINVEPDWTSPTEYFARQRRFRDGEIDLEATIRVSRQRYKRLETLAQEFPYQTEEG